MSNYLNFQNWRTLPKARELRREKKRSEVLVYQMLPKTVADNLRQNRSRPVSEACRGLDKKKSKRILGSDMIRLDAKVFKYSIIIWYN